MQNGYLALVLANRSRFYWLLLNGGQSIFREVPALNLLALSSTGLTLGFLVLTLGTLGLVGKLLLVVDLVALGLTVATKPFCSFWPVTRAFDSTSHFGTFRDTRKLYSCVYV